MLDFIWKSWWSAEDCEIASSRLSWPNSWCFLDDQGSPGCQLAPAMASATAVQGSGIWLPDVVSFFFYFLRVQIMGGRREGAQLWDWKMVWRGEESATGGLKYIFYICICKLGWGEDVSCMLLFFIIVYSFCTAVRALLSMKFFPSAVHLCTLYHPRKIMILPLFRRIVPSRWQQHSSVSPKPPLLRWAPALLPGRARSILGAALGDSHLAVAPGVSCL